MTFTFGTMSQADPHLASKTVPRLIRDLIEWQLIAGVLGTFVVLPVFLSGLWIGIEYRCSRMPSDDAALKAWLEKAELPEWDVERRSDGVGVYVLSDGLSVVFEPPPMLELGYQVEGAELGLGLLDRNLQRIMAELQTPWVLTGLMVSIQLPMLWIAWRRFRRARRGEDLLWALWHGPTRPAVFRGLAGGASLFAAGLIYELLLSWVGLTANRGPWPSVASFSRSEQLLVLSLAVTLGPLAEELFFRGVIFGSLAAAGRRRAAWLWSAPLFAAAHLSLVNFPIILVYGLVLAWLYERTRCLAAPLAAHVLNNGLALALIMTGI